MSIISRLTAADIVFLRRGSKAAAKAEQRGTKAMDEAFQAAIWAAAEACCFGEREPPPAPNFELLLLGVIGNAMSAAFNTQPRLPADATKKLAAMTNKPLRMPSNAYELRLWWDAVRGGRAPVRIQKIAEKIKRAYINSVQSVWAQASEQFRQGQRWDQTEVRQIMTDALKAAKARANTVVATETTRYYNRARRSYYDKLPTVTHYMFVAIRDKRTTKWCNTRQGVIYDKDSPLLTRETPPIHFNCRSEILPLSPYNKRHKALIDDPSLQRDNRRPEPLPKGWNK